MPISIAIIALVLVALVCVAVTALVILSLKVSQRRIPLESRPQPRHGRSTVFTGEPVTTTPYGGYTATAFSPRRAAREALFSGCTAATTFSPSLPVTTTMLTGNAAMTFQPGQPVAMTTFMGNTASTIQPGRPALTTFGSFQRGWRGYL